MVLYSSLETWCHVLLQKFLVRGQVFANRFDKQLCEEGCFSTCGYIFSVSSFSQHLAQNEDVSIEMVFLDLFLVFNGFSVVVLLKVVDFSNLGVFGDWQTTRGTTMCIFIFVVIVIAS